MLGPWPWIRRRLWSTLLCLALSIANVAVGSAQQPDAAGRVRALNAEAIEASRRGAYIEATAAAERALWLAHEVLGSRHPDTLTSINNLVVLYMRQGRHSEAEPLLRQALEGQREALG